MSGPLERHKRKLAAAAAVDCIANALKADTSMLLDFAALIDTADPAVFKHHLLRFIKNEFGEDELKEHVEWMRSIDDPPSYYQPVIKLNKGGR